MLEALQTLGGLALLIVGGDLLVRGAVHLAEMLRIPAVVIGLTVVAFGTSAPELAVSVRSAYAGATDVAIGNVVGSNIFNVLFILGLSALIVPLMVTQEIIRRDVPLVIAASVFMLVLARDGNLSRWEGLVLFGCLLGYIGALVWQVRRGTVVPVPEDAQPALPGGVGSVAKQIVVVVAGLVLLSFGAQWLVDGAVAIAQRLGASELVIGLTIVAGGTSLPELITSVVAAWRGQRDIAVGNVVGSNLFNILCVLGLSSAVAPAGLNVSAAAIRFDIPVMMAVAIACLPVFFTGRKIARWEGAVFFTYYLVYVTYLIVDATNEDLSRTLGTAMIWFVIPITAVTLAVSIVREPRD